LSPAYLADPLPAALSSYPIACNSAPPEAYSEAN